MTIDLTPWTEYVFGDTGPGTPPFGIELEFLQVMTISKVMARSEEVGPWIWRKLPGNETKITTYWKIKK